MALSLIDSHCHVQFPAYDPDRGEVIARALAAGVGMVNVGTQHQTSADAVRLAEQHPEGVWATVGFHPNHVGGDAHHDPMELREPRNENFDISIYRNIARHPKVVAIGECGLDYYRIADSGQRTADSIKEQQQDVFWQQIRLAREVRKPLVVHCRNAFVDLIIMLSADRFTLSAPAGVVHFFSGSWGDARKLLDLGFYLGFGGVITFVRDYDEVVQKVPLDRLLVETDAPYVAPAPFRGKRNEPAYIVETVKKIAELRGAAAEEIAARTTENAQCLFGV